MSGRKSAPRLVWGLDAVLAVEGFEVLFSEAFLEAFSLDLGVLVEDIGEEGGAAGE